jgi:hypothetical protein
MQLPIAYRLIALSGTCDRTVIVQQAAREGFLVSILQVGGRFRVVE